MLVIHPRSRSRAFRKPTRLLITAMVAIAALAAHGLPAHAEVLSPAAAGWCPLVPPPAEVLPADLAAAFEPVATNGSAPACPTPVACPGVNTGFCTDTDLGPCCTSGGATLCCPTGTTLKVHQCVYTWVSGVVGRGICFGREVSCG